MCTTISSAAAMLLFVVFALLAVALADPSTHCSSVGIDLFSVSASTPQIEGAEIANVTGTYPQVWYTVKLATVYNGPDIDVDITLAQNITTPAIITFMIALNGVFKMQGGMPQLFTNPENGTTLIQFTNWEAKPNNTLRLLVNEIIMVDGDITSCAYEYDVVFLNPKRPPAIVGDPAFTGLRGQKFQIHGIDGGVYNIISDESIQLNARFAYLVGPRACPVMPSTGVASVGCWAHNGSYLGSLGLRTFGESRLYVDAGSGADGFASVLLNGVPLIYGVPTPLDFSGTQLEGYATLLNSHELYITAGHFIIEIENSDEFVNLRSVSVHPSSWSKLRSEGLLGQTWRKKVYNGPLRYLKGKVDDYGIFDRDIFGCDFIFNVFKKDTVV